ncbi:MAG: hypothetical protein AAFU60_15985 [Bacteroidota bacterium]
MNKILIGIVLMVLSVGIVTMRIIKKERFEAQVTGYLKLAADANTIDLAAENLEKAIAFLEANNLTSGNTGVLWETPERDIDFWYRNLTASLEGLKNLESDNPLEITNVLIKLRETLVDTGDNGNKVTVPKGIEVYPRNQAWMLYMLLAMVLFTVGLAMSVGEAEKNRKLAAGE